MPPSRGGEYDQTVGVGQSFTGILGGRSEFHRTSALCVHAVHAVRTCSTLVPLHHVLEKGSNVRQIHYLLHKHVRTVRPRGCTAMHCVQQPLSKPRRAFLFTFLTLSPPLAIMNRQMRANLLLSCLVIFRPLLGLEIIPAFQCFAAFAWGLVKEPCV